ncbi:hypothetical protein Vwe01_27440 [Micromonospora andamanensis]|nr:hypothetical protein Vwe01_27440 [Micromonospora andamanensis]
MLKTAAAHGAEETVPPPMMYGATGEATAPELAPSTPAMAVAKTAIRDRMRIGGAPSGFHRARVHRAGLGGGRG